MPAAEVDVTAELVRSLLESQHPDLADLPLVLIANGWDNVLYRLGDELMVRLPRREMAAVLVAHECRWLPEIAPHLPLPVPTPVRIGEPSDDYPWSWTIVPWFEGTAIGTEPLDHPDAVARSLGEFVAALHQPATGDYPPNPYRGGPLAERDDTTTERLGCLDDEPDFRSAVEAAWRSALEAPPWDGPPIWLHGDLHPANIIVRDGSISAVIDFGDITAGDPATDLLVAWALFDSAEREIFREAADTPTRPIDDAMWERGRGWGASHGLAIVSSSADNAFMRAIARRTLEAVTERNGR